MCGKTKQFELSEFPDIIKSSEALNHIRPVVKNQFLLPLVFSGAGEHKGK